MKVKPINPKYLTVVTDCDEWLKQKNPRCTKVFIRTYHNEEVVKAFLQDFYNDAFAYIVHDADKNDDGTPKETHIHLLCVFSCQVSLTAIAKHFQGQNTLVQNPYSLPTAYRYLTHTGFEGKTPYDVNCIVSYNATKLALTEQERKQQRNTSLIEDIENGKSHRELAMLYGADYIKNYNRYHEFVSIMRLEEEKAEMEKFEVDYKDFSVFDMLGLDYHEYCKETNKYLAKLLFDFISNSDECITYDDIRNKVWEVYRLDPQRRNAYIRREMNND